MTAPTSKGPRRDDAQRPASSRRLKAAPAPAPSPLEALLAGLGALLEAHKASAIDGPARVLWRVLASLHALALQALAAPSALTLEALEGEPLAVGMALREKGGPAPSTALKEGAKGGEASSKAPAPVAPPVLPSPPGSLLALDSVLRSLVGSVRELLAPSRVASPELRQDLTPKLRAGNRAARLAHLARLAAQLDQVRAQLCPALILPAAPPALDAATGGLAWDALMQRIAELSWLASGAKLPPGCQTLAAHLDHVHAVLRRHRFTGAELKTGPDGELIARLRPAS